jgi:hypothetical protein
VARLRPDGVLEVDCRDLLARFGLAPAGAAAGQAAPEVPLGTVTPERVAALAEKVTG